MNESTYAVDENGIISEPGKFEGELACVPVLWDRVLNGESDEEVWDEILSTTLSLLIFEPGEAAKLNIEGEPWGVALWESDQGFVNSIWLDSKADWDQAKEEIEADPPTEAEE